jgi:hypothetical protein
MTLDELVSSVATITNRPELSAEMLIAVQRATLKMHTIDFFPKDIQILSFPSAPLTNIVVDLPKTARVRKVKAVVGQTPFGRSIQLRSIGFKDFVGFGGAKKDGFFVQGSRISIVSREPISNALVAYYEFPDTSRETYSSWIADLYPFAIIDDACASIYAQLGDLQQAEQFNRRVGDKSNLVTGCHLHTILAEQLYEEDLSVQ